MSFYPMDVDSHPKQSPTEKAPMLNDRFRIDRSIRVVCERQLALLSCRGDKLRDLKLTSCLRTLCYLSKAMRCSKSQLINVLHHCQNMQASKADSAAKKLFVGCESDVRRSIRDNYLFD